MASEGREFAWTIDGKVGQGLKARGRPHIPAFTFSRDWFPCTRGKVGPGTERSGPSRWGCARNLAALRVTISGVWFPEGQMGQGVKDRGEKGGHVQETVPSGKDGSRTESSVSSRGCAGDLAALRVTLSGVWSPEGPRGKDGPGTERAGSGDVQERDSGMSGDVHETWQHCE